MRGARARVARAPACTLTAAPFSRYRRHRPVRGRAYVVARGGEVRWSFREAEVGDSFDVDEVVAAVQALN